MRGTIEKRGKQSWRVAVYVGRNHDGKREFLRRTVRGTRRDAEEVLAQLVIQTGQRAGDDLDLTVADLLDQWLAHRQPALSPSTVSDTRSVINRHLKPALGDLRLYKLTARDLDALYTRLVDTGLGPSRVRRVHNIMSAALNQAVKWDLVASNIASKASPPRLEERERRPPTPDEINQLLTTAEAVHPDLPAFLRLAFTTGCRRGELLALRWSRVDLSSGELAVTHSLVGGTEGHRAEPVEGHGWMSERDTTKAGRTVTLGPTSLAALAEVRARAEHRAALVEAEISADGWVFSDHETAKTPWALHRPTRMFAQARDKAGLDPDLHLHDFRHAAATQALTAGHDLLTVAGRLGHRRVSTTTDRYGHVIPSADQGVADHLDDLLTNEAES